MKLSGIHLLLTYQCTFECDHCFVFGSPWQTGTMTISMIRTIINQAKEAGSIDWIYFEGGEPFLYYQTMLAGIDLAIDAGFKIGVVTNSYWATSDEDAYLWLKPLAGKVQDLTISSDLFHFSVKISQQSQVVSRVAERLNIPLGVICIEQPAIKAPSSVGQILPESSSIMYRGRAAVKLVPSVSLYSSQLFTACPHEDLADPGRVHLDPIGNVHVCQGISIGNIFTSTLKEICSNYDPNNHPIIGPLYAGGPVQLVDQFKLIHDEAYADACHMCFEARKSLRNSFPSILGPDQMYCVPGT